MKKRYTVHGARLKVKPNTRDLLLTVNRNPCGLHLV